MKNLVCVSLFIVTIVGCGQSSSIPSETGSSSNEAIHQFEFVAPKTIWDDEPKYEMNTSERFQAISSLNAVTGTRGFAKCHNGNYAILLAGVIEKRSGSLKEYEYQIHIYNGSKQLLAKFEVDTETFGSNSSGPFQFTNDCEYLYSYKWTYRLSSKQLKYTSLTGYVSTIQNVGNKVYFHAYGSREVGNYFGSLDLESGTYIKDEGFENELESISESNYSEKDDAWYLLESKYGDDWTDYMVHKVTYQGTEKLYQFRVSKESNMTSARFLDSHSVIFSVTSDDRTSKSYLYTLENHSDPLIINGGAIKRFDKNHLILGNVFGTNESQILIYNENSKTYKNITKNHLVGRFFSIKMQNGEAYLEFSSNLHENRIYKISKNFELEPFFQTTEMEKGIKIERHRVQSTDGFVYPAYLYKQESSEPLDTKGTVIYVHGGGCHKWDGGFSLSTKRPEFYDLIKEGYQVLGISYRNDLFPGHYIRWNKEQCGTKEIEDILAAQDYVLDLFPRKPLFIYGFSQGAYLTNVLLTQHIEKFQGNGVISGAGVWSIEKAMRAVFLEDYEISRDPLKHLKKLEVPVLVYHGRQDENVPFENASLFLESYFTLSGNNGEVLDSNQTYVESPDGMVSAFLPSNEDHFIGDMKISEHYDLWMNYLQEFLEKNSR